jgi:hypothetical protein
MQRRATDTARAEQERPPTKQQGMNPNLVVYEGHQLAFTVFQTLVDHQQAGREHGVAMIHRLDRT